MTLKEMSLVTDKIKKSIRHKSTCYSKDSNIIIGIDSDLITLTFKNVLIYDDRLSDFTFYVDIQESIDDVFKSIDDQIKTFKSI